MQHEETCEGNSFFLPGKALHHRISLCNNQPISPEPAGQHAEWEWPSTGKKDCSCSCQRIRSALQTSCREHNLSVYMLNNSESRALILGPEFVEDIQRYRKEIKTVKEYISISEAAVLMMGYEQVLAQSSSEEKITDMASDDLCSLNYTSGTGGVLKAAMISHRNWGCVAKKFLLNGDMEIQKDSIMCHVAPITHFSGTIILSFIIRGGCNLILRGFDIEILLKTIEEEHVTHLILVPTMLNLMMAHPEIKKYDLRSIRTILYGASPMPVERIKQALDIFGPVLIQGYGLTETADGITFLSKEDHKIDEDSKKLKRLSSAGLPSCESLVRIVNDNGEDIKPGEVGEIIEKGDDTMIGYWKAPELTAETLRGGWVRTKDMATIDEDGYIYIVDRKADMIISGGFNIYPSEVENVLISHPAVFEAAVIGVPDELWGESVKAVIVCKKGMKVSENELIEHCKMQLASYKKPKSVEFVEEIPKNSYGKIVRRMIKEKYWANQDRMVH